MSRPSTIVDGRFATFVDVDGNPPCDPPDDCDVCRLFTRPLPGETLAAWGQRILGTTATTQRRAS